MQDGDRKFSVELQPMGRRTQVSAGDTLLSAVQSIGVELQAVCAGNGTCGRCKVRLVSGHLSEPTPEELSHFTSESIQTGHRLACQALALSDVALDIPPDSLTAVQRVQLEGVESRLQVDRTFPPEWSKQGTPVLGIAVDLGTTKIAGYLVDLQTGETLAKQGVMNPQILHGEDVIGRISFASRSLDGGRHLQQTVVQAINELSHSLCKEVGTSHSQIFEAVVAGNSVMHHLFAGLPVEQLGKAPFLPASTRPLFFPTSQVGMLLENHANIYTPPNIAGYVGGDHVAMLLGVDINEAEEPTLGIDIGTNTEMTLKANGRLLSCSCASGPAFEGAHIRYGMRAAPGAIERVVIHKGSVQYYTIDRRPAVGICGSGILDAIAALLDAGMMDERGKFRQNAPGVRLNNGNCEFVLVDKTAAADQVEIVLTQQDVSEIQLAKAAIRAGIDVLLDTGGVEAKDLKKFLIAGAFGSYLDPRSAVRIGMFPHIALDRVRQVGNAAGLGARQMLVSVTKRREAEELARHVQYMELATHVQFQEKFAKALLL